MRLKLFYKPPDGEEKSVLFNFTNRPTMNNIKDALQTIVARSRTVIKDSPAPAAASDTKEDTETPGASSTGSTPAPSSTPSAPTQSAANPLSFNTPESLSDASLLKNLQLQQKYLLEDRNLRNIFTQSVMNFKLSPSIFWSTRLNQLRTYALTISQHRGPYNVLSTIKPVATSDNQVNVNVTRDTINEIFDTYPIIKKAFSELVPAKFSEGEFWSRFFNSKLFRRLRGDKINNSNNRGDVILDKYLYIDQSFVEFEEKEKEKEKEKEQEQEAKKRKVDSEKNVEEQTDIRVSKFMDLFGNEVDNSQKLGNRPDFTMRFDDDSASRKVNIGQENEMIILMKNMNKLSSKMVDMSNSASSTQQSLASHKKANGESSISVTDAPDALSIDEISEYQQELNLHDLNEIEETSFVQLSINTNLENKSAKNSQGAGDEIQFTPEDLASYLIANKFQPHSKGINFTDTYRAKEAEIKKSSDLITALIKQNFRTFKLISKDSSSHSSNSVPPQNLVPESIVQEIITYNITIVEFLSHFWKLFLNGNNPNQLKKLFTSLKNCRNDLNALKERATKIFEGLELVKTNEKLKDKLLRSFQSCLDPLEISLDKACNEYIDAVRAAQQAQAAENRNGELNENGKRPLK
ncbi:RNA polymerase II transcription factor B 73 kDa subunit [Scheffersomyces xylosifermentans]|uniref:RNA polymerase II transcription factor B 73 kDa subunit n=1 Tax=Scheffersomyces xylosifermentans TaxID=1304137 RepID=UPI00315E02D4